MKTTSDEVLVIYNRNSTNARLADEDVRRPIADLNLPVGQVQEHILRYPRVEDNIADLSESIHDGQRLIVVGGDGTLHTVGNAVSQSGSEDVKIGATAHGNFCDWVRAHNETSDLRNPLPLLEEFAATARLHPLELFVNGERRREGMLYFTIGQSAVLASLFNDPDVRRELHNGKSSAIHNYSRLLKEYFARRGGNYLSAFYREDGILQSDQTDTLHINNSRIARFAHLSYDPGPELEYVLTDDLDISRIPNNIPFIAKSLVRHMPGRKVRKDTIHFAQPSDITVQADGEDSVLRGVNTLTVQKKAGNGLTMLVKRSLASDASRGQDIETLSSRFRN